MTTVAGIDLSLTSTGLALATAYRHPDTSLAVSGLPESLDNTIETRCVESKGKTKDTLINRGERLEQISSEIYAWAGRSADLVVIEGMFAAGQVGGAQLDRHGLWWIVVRGLQRHGVPVVAVAPAQSKKFLTGEGRADKGTMVRWAGKLWPDWEPSTSSKTEDEADAIALASVGLALLDLAPFEMTDYRKDIVKKLRPQLEKEN